MNSVRRAHPIATGSALPSPVVTNAKLIEATGIDSTPEWILENTGIAERRIAGKNEKTSDYGAQAAKQALERAGISPTSLDLIILATSSPDRGCPSTAMRIQELIGANCPAYDVSAGCSGFGFAFSNANAYIKSGIYRRILVIGADLLSKITNYSDRGTCILLGDGAGAMILEAGYGPYGIFDTILGSDGTKSSSLFIPTGEELRAMTEQGLICEQGKLFMDGPAVFKFAVQILPEMIEQILSRNLLLTELVDLIFPHQANKRIITTAQRRFGAKLPIERFYMNLDRYANTSAASIPIAIDEWAISGAVTKGKIILLVAFGAGLTWSAALLRWPY
jgi:3-oxoacyl-[acyl-carrier-protein] synthase-3